VNAPTLLETALFLTFRMNNDSLTKSPEGRFFVIPEKSGSQSFQQVTNPWTPAFAGETTFCEFINN
jgi:hypothetical protein